MRLSPVYRETYQEVESLYAEFAETRFRKIYVPFMAMEVAMLKVLQVNRDRKWP